MDEDEAFNDEILEGAQGGQWIHERWWYTLVHVCRRWRYLVLHSPSYLHLSLLCTRRTPVADMLANSPHLPLVIDHFDEENVITIKDEQGIILALQHRDRVRRIRLSDPIPYLQKFILALDGEFPILEFLLIYHSYSVPTDAHDMSLNIPETFRAPHLRHLMLTGFAISIESPLLTTMGNLVTLNLDLIPPSAYFHPNALLQRISLMPQLEILGVFFGYLSPSSDVERQFLPAAITARVTFPNLRGFGFQGASAYLEALLPWVNFPLLERFQVYFINQMTYSIPHLQQFMSTAGNLRPIAITLDFYEDYLHMSAYPREGARVYTLAMALDGSHLDWQVASAAQVFHAIETVFSAVEHLTLRYNRHLVSSEWNNEVDRTQWRELFRTFCNVKAFSVEEDLVGQLSRSLQSSEGESPTELLPELQELSYYSTDGSQDAFAQFIEARQKACRPVTVINLPANDSSTVGA